MGNCYQRQRSPVRNINRNTHRGRADVTTDEEGYYARTSTQEALFFDGDGGSHRRRGTLEGDANMIFRQSALNWKLTHIDIDKHVLDTLNILRKSAENDTELILRMRMFRFWANGETGWSMVLHSLIRAIPLDDALGPSAITLFIDHCPLPTKKSVIGFVADLELTREKAISMREMDNSIKNKDKIRHRNICTVLGHLAERLAGAVGASILTPSVLNYFVETLEPSKKQCHIHTLNILYSLIALEKFAQTKANKNMIQETDVFKKLQNLELFLGNKNLKNRQVGFAAQWLLDNVFVSEDRLFSYETADLSNVNAILNSNDVSEYLKISPTGLEARSDASSFESVRCTFSVDSGVWFYEVTIITTGVMQIGWATKQSKFLNYEGFGIGDDEYSCAYDGCRQLFWFEAQSRKHAHPVWKEGDTLGLLLDLDKPEAIFYLNGNPLPPVKSVFKYARSGFFAAASFMSFQQCIFNFGASPFKYPPIDRQFKSFNDHAHLTNEEKIILPRYKKLKMVEQSVIPDNYCTLCCDEPVNTVFKPCGHSGVCSNCAEQLTLCHLCRSQINARATIVPAPE